MFKSFILLFQFENMLLHIQIETVVKLSEVLFDLISHYQEHIYSIVDKCIVDKCFVNSIWAFWVVLH